MVNRSLLSLLALSLLPSAGALAQSLAPLRHVRGTEPVSGTEYARLLLPGRLLSNSPLTPVALAQGPTLIAQCTRQPTGELAFDIFLAFDAAGLDRPAPLPISAAEPRSPRVDLTLNFSGYTEIGGLKHPWDTLDESTGLLRYSTTGVHSANMEDAPNLLRYLVALPTLRLTETDRSAIFETSPLLTDIRSEPLCKAALL